MKTQCPRARSGMTPCAMNDGDCATFDDKTCVGCRATPDVYRPVTAHPEGWSAEPFSYDAKDGTLRDANGHLIASMESLNHKRDDANGHRIASLSKENAAIRADLSAVRAALPPPLDPESSLGDQVDILWSAYRKELANAGVTADRIASLSAENARLREALENLMARLDDHFGGVDRTGDWTEQEQARTALRPAAKGGGL